MITHLLSLLQDTHVEYLDLVSTVFKLINQVIHFVMQFWIVPKSRLNCDHSDRFFYPIISSSYCNTVSKRL